MYHVDNSTGVPVMPLPSPITSETELFFTEGGNGVPPTYPGPDWFNAIQSELLNIIRAAGLDPDKMDNTQILAALKKLFLSRSNPFGDIKTDGAAAIATALSNLGLTNPNGRVGRMLAAPKIFTSSEYTRQHQHKINFVEVQGAGGPGECNKRDWHSRIIRFRWWSRGLCFIWLDIVPASASMMSGREVQVAGPGEFFF